MPGTPRDDPPLVLDALPYGAPVPDGYAGLLLRRPPAPRGREGELLLHVDDIAQPLAAGDWVVPVAPGRHVVEFRRARWPRLLGQAVVTVEPGEHRALVLVWGRALTYLREPENDDLAAPPNPAGTASTTLSVLARCAGVAVLALFLVLVVAMFLAHAG